MYIHVHTLVHQQVVRIRKMLTEVLLEVTNQEIESAAKETLEEESSEYTGSIVAMTMCIWWLLLFQSPSW